MRSQRSKTASRCSSEDRPTSSAQLPHGEASGWIASSGRIPSSAPAATANARARSEDEPWTVAARGTTASSKGSSVAKTVSENASAPSSHARARLSPSARAP